MAHLSHIFNVKLSNIRIITGARVKPDRVHRGEAGRFELIAVDLITPEVGHEHPLVRPVDEDTVRMRAILPNST